MSKPLLKVKVLETKQFQPQVTLAQNNLYLQTFLAPEEAAQEGDIIDEGKTADLPFDKGGSQNNSALKTPQKQDKVDKFDELFS